MGDHDKPPGELPQTVLQPEDHVAVQVVGGLVQNEHIRRVEEDRRQGHPLALAAGEGPHRLGKVRQAQPGEHGLGLIVQKGPGVWGKPGKDLLQHRGPRLHGGILGQKAHLNIGVSGDAALVGGLLAGQDPEKAALSRAVDADQAHLVALAEVEGHVVQQWLEAEVEADVFCGEQHRGFLLWVPVGDGVVVAGWAKGWFFSCAVGTGGSGGRPGGGPCGFLPAPLERRGTVAYPAGAPFLGKKWGKEPQREEVLPSGLPSLVGLGGGRLYFLWNTWPAALSAKGP